MKMLGPSSEEEMVAEFLRGELDSPRFGPPLRKEMKAVGLPEIAVIEPNLEDSEENELRAEVLGNHRGWLRNEYLFVSFPRRITWERSLISSEDLPRVFYPSSFEWEAMSGGTYSPVVAARRIENGKAEGLDLSSVEAIRAKLARGEPMYRPLTVGTRSGSIITMLEGSSRITAHLLNGFPEQLEIIHGSTDMRSLMAWQFFPSNRALIEVG